MLANTDDTYGAHCVVEDFSVAAGQTIVRPTAKIDRTALREFYKQDGSLKDNARKPASHVYVFCNPTSELTALIDGLSYGDSWTDESCQVLQGKTSADNKNVDIWADNSFLMSNASSAVRAIPSTFETWRVNHDTQNNAFDLSGSNNKGGVDNSATTGEPPTLSSSNACRGAFRFQGRKLTADTDANTYNIGLEDQNGLLQVKLCRMALVNMSRNFYYLRRVSDDGMGKNKVLCRLATDANYVDDTDAGFKAAENIPAAQLAAHFNYSLFDVNGRIDEDTRGQWDNYWIDDVLGNPEDINAEYNKKDYHIWRYVTENTVPQDNDKQRNGVTTGVVFKGKLLASDGLKDVNPSLYNAIEGTYSMPDNTTGYTYDVQGRTYPILYTFLNMIYVGWNAGVSPAATAAGETTDLYKAVNEMPEGSAKSPDALYQELVAAKGTSGEAAALDAFRKAATSAGFTL